MPKREKISKWPVLPALLLAAWLPAACGDKSSEPKPVIRPVRHQIVTSIGGAPELTYSGVSKSGTEIKLSFRVGGSIRSLAVGVGDRVKTNDLIATLDDADAKLNRERVEISLAKAKVQAETAEANLKRIRALYESNNVSLSEYEAAKERDANAAAEYRAEKRSLNLIDRELAYYRLRAPMDGIITAKDVSRNENVQAGQLVVVLETGDLIEVSVGVPEQNIVRIEKGQAVRVRFPAVTNVEFRGIVNEVSFAIDAASSTYPVTVVLSDVSEKIRPGMPADVTFQLDVVNSVTVLIVPVNAVAKGLQGTYVFVVTPTEDDLGIVNKRSVEIGPLTRQGFELISGLDQGERVVTAGLDKMHDGLKVRLRQ
ncbi:MAG: efflux RND transporter periplasmic adaptor subunit [Desulfatitalea sp.]|nr:efflux RND transporter periplasmic adaptor subunit [Desulfatitalea sp.]NNK00949.1 efflux RND transporter periplasmic adaptor subunit [Desulfatitalea sp.]